MTSSIDSADLSQATGGMKWQGRRQSLNVEDRRPGAPSLADQRAATIKFNNSLGSAGNSMDRS